MTLAPTLTIGGRVLGPDGEPAQRGRVTLEPAVGSSELKRDGTFEIGGLEPARYVLTATVVEGHEDQGAFWPLELQATVTNVKAGASGVVIHVTGGGNLVVRFHPVGEPDKPLEVWNPSICWGDYGGGSGGKRSEIRMTFKAGRRHDIRVEAEGYKTKFLGPIDISPDRKTVVDVELEPAD